MTTRARTGPPSLVLVLVVLAALAVGAAASAIAGAARAPSTPSGPTEALAIPATLVAYGFLGVVLAAVAFFVYRRLTGAAGPIPNQFIVGALIGILLLVLFVVAAHTILHGGLLPLGSTSAGTNNTTGTPANATGNATINVTGGSGADSFLGVHFPPWTLFVVVAVVVFTVVIAAVPEFRAIFSSIGRRGPDAEARGAVDRARTALAIAVQDLGSGQDPRAVIVALYAALLTRLGPIVGDLDPSTPEEIRSFHLVRLGIRPEAASALTRLFEEARYSSHPMDATSAARATEVILAADADLSRRAVRA